MSLYLQVRIEDHPFWPFAADRMREDGPKDVPFALSQWADRKHRLTGPKVARDALAYLRRHYDADYMPVELVDEDGQPVALTSSTDSDMLRLFSVTATAMYQKLSFCRNEQTLWRKVESDWDLLGVKPDGQFVVGSPRRDKHMMVMAPPIVVKSGAAEGQHGVRIFVPRAPGPSCVWYATPKEARAAYRETVEREQNLGVPGIVQVEHVEGGQPVAREFITRRLPNYG